MNTGNSIDLRVLNPVVFSTNTCSAPTVTVLAINADTTPNAKVSPNDFSGGKGDRKLARKAKAVVTTDRVSANLRIENERTQASAGLRDFSLVFS